MTAVAAPGGVGQHSGVGRPGGLGQPSGGGRHVSVALPQAWHLHWSLDWSTPTRVKAQAVAVVAVACCLVAVTAVLLGQLHGNFGALGQTDAPEAESTASMYSALNDMDGQVANVLMVGADDALAGERASDLASYASDQSAVSKDLNQAAVAESGNPAAQQQLAQAVDWIGRYQALAADAMLTDQNAHSAAGHASASALTYFDQATDLMQLHILPSVESLTSASDANLNASYSSGKSAAFAGIAWAAVLGVLLLAALIVLQVYLAVRFRRLVNPALAAATMLVLVFSAVTVSRFYTEYTHLHVARYDSFGSVQALTMALGVSQDANADESRYLADPGRAAQYQQAFLAETQQIASAGQVTLPGYAPALEADIEAYQRDNSDIRFGGYLGTEFHNVTFPGERQAATAALLAFEQYERDDHTLRTMAQANLTAAVGYDMGTAADQSDGAFNAYDKAVQSDIAINSAAFTAAVATGESTASVGNLALVILVGLLTVALTYLGVRPRFREYR